MHGSDKGEIDSVGHSYWATHSYADLYSRLFSHCRQGIKRVFECGIGTINQRAASNMPTSYRPGASLRVWRDYFPSATIIGADIDRDILFEEDRIKTFFVDQRDPSTISTLWSAVGLSDFDLMIDDGLHLFEAGSCLFTHSISRLASSGIYVIEDVNQIDLLKYESFFDNTEFVVDFVTMFRPGVDLQSNILVVIRRP
jgi:hypothetical protein